jgi:hypothetical protein
VAQKASLAAAIKAGSTKLDARTLLPRSYLIVLHLLQDRKTMVPIYRNRAVDKDGIYVPKNIKAGDRALKDGILEEIKKGDIFYRIDTWRYAISEDNFLIDSVMHEVFKSSSITNATKTNYTIEAMSTFEYPRSLSGDEQIEVVLRESLSTYKQSDTLKHLRVSNWNDHLVALVGDNREYFIEARGQVLDLDLESNLWIRIVEEKDLQFNRFDFIPDQALDIFMVDHIIDTIWTQEKIPEGPLTALGTRVITHILKCMNRHVKVLDQLTRTHTPTYPQIHRASMNTTRLTHGSQLAHT